jgi:uncharacterized protein
MDQRVKDYLGYVIMAVLIVFAYAAFLYANSYAKMIQPGSYRTFAVTGQGRATAKNDIAKFSYSVVIQGGKDIVRVKKQSDDLTGKIQTVLKEQGVDPEEVETISYSLEPRYQYFRCPAISSAIPDNVPTIDIASSNSRVAVSSASAPCRPSEIVGYTLSQTDSVKIRDLTKVDKIVSGVVAAGANNVSQLSFTVDDPTSLVTEAKAGAIKKAIEQAKILAKAGGFRVGRIISIDEGYAPSYDSSSGMGGYEMKTLSAAAPMSVSSLNPGSNDITSTVSVRFEIE